MKRLITQNILQELNHVKRKIILILGQRRTGKTYELQQLLNEHKNALFFDLEDFENRDLFAPSVSHLESVIGDKNKSGMLLLDEIQYLENSGSILKLLHDHFPKLKVVVTGSASFLMLKNIGDSLMGRYFSYPLYPLTLREIFEIDHRPFSIGGFPSRLKQAKISGLLKNILIYGTLPEVYLESDNNRKNDYLKYYVNSLLFKDIFEIEGIRYPGLFKQLLHVLALQIGQEINPNEISKKFQIHRKTIIDYIDLFEKFYIIKVIRSFSQNPRKEISKGFKVFFTDIGVRNAIINNFAPLQQRNDLGALFENFVVNLFDANINYFRQPYKIYFWRNIRQAEVDLVLENTETGKLCPMEIKWSKDKMPSRAFRNLYENKIESEFCVNKDNLWKFL